MEKCFSHEKKNILQAIAENVELYEIPGVVNISSIAKLIGRLCTYSIITDICKLVFEQNFGPFSHNSYYTVMHIL